MLSRRRLTAALTSGAYLLTLALAVGGAAAPASAQAAGVIYVAPTGSDSNAGTATAPLATLQAAITAAGTAGIAQIDLAAGTYAGATVALASSLTISGGFDANTWTTTGPAAGATVIEATGTAVTADGVTGTTLQGLTLDATAPGADGSAYGARVSNSTLTLRDVAIEVADGAPGAGGVSNGLAGSAGAPGDAGTNGNYDNQTAVGVGGSGGSSGQYAGGDGGCGGWNSADGTTGPGSAGAACYSNNNPPVFQGAPGQAGAGPAGGAGGGGGATGTYPSDGTDGGSGGNGANGAAGVGGTQLLTVSGTQVQGAAGQDGTAGTAGSGGGGGGGGGGPSGQYTTPGAGNGGGGGGGGGTGGGQGRGGGAGGGSFGIAAVNSTLTLDAVSVHTGNGGTGGDGGAGLAGGSGGAGGNGGDAPGVGQGGKGGSGGNGGSGGGGGGGAGGASIALLLDSFSQSHLQAIGFSGAVGLDGPGGQGGSSPGLAGFPGNPGGPGENGLVRGVYDLTTRQGGLFSATQLQVAPAASAPGQPVTLTATVTGSGGASGTLTFTALPPGGGAPVTLGSTVLAGDGSASISTTSLTSVGAYAITASYGGSTYAAPSSATVQHAVQPIVQTATTLTPSVTQATYGQPVKLTASVTGADPAGSVDFIDNSGVFATAPLSGGQATLTTSTLPPGAQSLAAMYPGDAYNAPSASSSVTVTILQPAGISLSASPQPSALGRPVTLEATVTPAGSTGSVTFSALSLLTSTQVNLGTVALATYSGYSLAVLTTSGLPFGGSDITASYCPTAGPCATATLGHFVQVIVDTYTTLTSSQNPSLAGAPVTFTATVHGDGPTGEFEFTSGSLSAVVPLDGSGQATWTTSALPVGTDDVLAQYLGDGANAGSGTGVGQVVTPALAISTAVLPDATSGQAYTATLSASAGTPAYTWALDSPPPPGLSVSAAGVVSGTPTSPGTYALSVTVTDSSSPPQSASASVALVVVGAAVTATDTAVSTSGTATAQVGGVSVTGSGTGSVTVEQYASDPGGPSVNVNASGAYFDVSVSTGNDFGTVSVTDSSLAGGDAAYWWTGSVWQPVSPETYDASTGVLTITVNGDSSPTLAELTGTEFAIAIVHTPPQITSPASATFTVGRPGSFAITATGLPAPTIQTSSTPPPGLSLAASGPGQAALSGTPTAAGTYTLALTATNGFGSSASQTLTVTVDPAPVATTVAANVYAPVVDQAVTYTATVTPTPDGGTVAFADGGTTIAACASQSLTGGQATCEVTYTALGNHSITATYSGDANYVSNTSDTLAQTVSQAATTLTLSSQTVPAPDCRPGEHADGCAQTAPRRPVPPEGHQPRPAPGGVCGAGDHGDGAPGLPGLPAGGPRTVSGAVYLAPDTSIVCQPVTFTATVAVVAPGAGTPTGTVTFTDGTTTLGTVSLSAQGTAALTTDQLPAGPQSITATYGGDTHFTGSAATLTQHVQYRFVGLLPPLDHDLTVDPRQTVPIVFMLLDARGRPVRGATATLQVNGGTAIAFREVGPAYQYDLRLGDQGITSGTVTLTIAVSDGTTHTFTLTVRPPARPDGH